MTDLYEVIFDGGSRGNPGQGYGSWEITREGRVVGKNAETYGDRVTNNQAEYWTLQHALTWLADDLGEAAGRAAVSVHGDSQLVIRQLGGQWKIKDATLRGIAMEVRKQMNRFDTVSLNWHPRSVSVKRLGH